MNTETFDSLREANQARQAVWCPENKPDLSFRGNELAGETGEACNVIKKLERERHGWKGSRDTVEHLAQELAEVVITADLIAMQAGIDLGAAVRDKFNDTSKKHGFRIFLQAAASIVLACILLVGCAKTSQPSNWVESGDGLTYELVKPEASLPNGAVEVAEYVRTDDPHGAHYFMRTTHGNKPFFSRLP